MSLFRHIGILLFFVLLAAASCQQKGSGLFPDDGVKYSTMGDETRRKEHYGDAVSYYKKAQECFAAAKDTLNLWRMNVAIADTYTEMEVWQAADSLFHCVLDKKGLDDDIMAQAWLGLMHLKVVQPGEVDAEGARECFIKAVEVHHGQPDNTDYYRYGYVSALLGDPQDGLDIINQTQKRDTSMAALAHYYKYKIYTYLKDEEKARTFYGNYKAAYLGSHSLYAMTRQKEVFDSELRFLKQQRRIILLTVIIVLLLLSGIIGMLVRINKKRKAELNRKAEDLIALTEELKQAHSDNEASINRIKLKFKELFQAQFKTLEKLYIAFNTPDAVRQDAVFGEAGQILKFIGSDHEKQLQFEQYLDHELDGIMHKFRSDFPNLKETDYRLFSYSITGFSARTIAGLTGFTTGSVYTKRNALKCLISESGSAYKDQYFHYL